MPQCTRRSGTRSAHPTNSSDPAISHDLNTVGVSDYLSMFLRMQLMKNNHTFPSLEEQDKHSGGTTRSSIVASGEGTQLFFL